MDMEIYFPGGKRVDAKYGDLIIPTDQSVKSGGDGSAPAPFDLFLTSIGACAGIYVLSFCQSRNIPTDDIRLKMSINYNQQIKLIDTITITVELPSDFPEKYVQPVIKAAELCAVAKHLYNPPQIKLEAEVKQETSV
ncbi:OsmC family protein [candidate division CSSED10-310 bacterium]|uniref:OsmC family protein n=1 Tax=candidate division CSSED10-310 bacterium TaxID=2855610 RepID=A0ABV6YS00_UNCC1